MADTEERDLEQQTNETAQEPETAPEEETDAVDAAAARAESALRQAEQERDEYKEALIRERADFENYRKRNAGLSATSYDRGVGDAVSAVLPVLDNFERALAAECADQAYADGMNMIMRQMQGVIQGLGAEEIDTQGEFDPTFHHAVMQTEDPELGENQISETLQKGYSIKGRVLRPAMVKVNK